jgi:hypothetical protein
MNLRSTVSEFPLPPTTNVHRNRIRSFIYHPGAMLHNMCMLSSRHCLSPTHITSRGPCHQIAHGILVPIPVLYLFFI